MGQISSVLSTITSAANAFSRTSNTIRNLDKNGNQLKELQQQQELASAQLASRQQLEEGLALKKKQQDEAMLQAEAAQTERRRIAALKASTASQRAAYGGAGVSADDGSGEAVLLGLFQQSDAERNDQDQINGIRQKILDENYGALQAQNLLEATQLAERQALQRRLI